MTDITIPINGCRIVLRVGAIICDKDKVLICSIPGQDWWFTPGGRIKLRESSRDALERELSEELGEDWVVKDSVIFSENFFTHEGEDFHEMCVYYEVEWLGEPKTEQMAKSKEEFVWVERKYLKDYNLLPEFLYGYLNSPKVPFLHSITRDGQPVAGGDATRWRS